MRKLWLLTCFAVSLMAADVSGKWAGKVVVDDPNGTSTIETEVRAEMHQTGDTISGSIGREGDDKPEPIQNAKLDGNRLTFEVSSAEMGGLIKFQLTLAGDRLEGQMSGSMDSVEIKGKVQMSRAGGGT